jgi:hypothetical protein
VADTNDEDAGYAWPPGCLPPAPVVYDAAADAPNCAYRVSLPCGLPPFVTTIDPVRCLMPLDSCIQLCTGVAAPFLSCEVANGFGCDDDAGAFVAADGAPIVVECDKCTIAGRRPPGLRGVRTLSRAAAPAGVRAAGHLGRFLARLAHLEAASVPAFTRLAGELAVLRAPAPLVQSARRAARDEARHARAMTALARHHGVEPPRVRLVAPRRPRTRAAVALDNAVEGCVRETFGALLAAWQATHALDARIATAMSRIALDEARHAALAWSIARWLEPRLDARALRRLRAATRRAVARLHVAVRAPLALELTRDAGLPTRAQATRLLTQLEMSLWDTGPAAMGQ